MVVSVSDGNARRREGPAWRSVPEPGIAVRDFAAKRAGDV